MIHGTRSLTDNRRANRTSLLLRWLMILLVAPRAFAEIEDLSVLKGWIEWSDSSNQLQHHLNRVAFKFLEERRNKIKSLATVEDWKHRQQEVKDTLNRIIGPFPERTPLNAKVVGTVKKEGFRIEKIVFESMPNFFVTACLFIPDNLQGKTPAILNLIGHTDIAFRAPSYQQLVLNLVKKGFIVLAVDPLGQGERLQYYDAAVNRSVVGGPTTEHSYFGKQCFLTGSSAARYFTWDAIRAIDYLVSRPEVDPSRIGVTGISGGGTQTSYVAALDERVAAAAPTCYICGFHRLFESIGPQDAEQNFNGGVASGIDHADFLEVRAQNPRWSWQPREIFSVSRGLVRRSPRRKRPSVPSAPKIASPWWRMITGMAIQSRTARPFMPFSRSIWAFPVAQRIRNLSR